MKNGEREKMQCNTIKREISIYLYLWDQKIEKKLK